MLWSLIKILVFVAIVAGITLGAGYLLEVDQDLRIAVAGIEFSLGPLQAIIAVIVLVAAVWVVLKLVGFVIALLRFINGDETALSRYFDRNRERRGYQAVADSLMALSSGEGKVAMQKAQKADRLLQKPEMTNLLVAQAAEMTGDKKKAAEVYKALLQDQRTRFVGVRGLMRQKLSEGDTETALALAEKCFSLKPGNAETQDVLLKLQAEKHDWKGARKTLGAQLKSGGLPRDVHRRRDAVLALSEAAELIDEDSSIETREAAIEANRLSPDLIPAAAMAARGYIAKKKPRYATRVLKKAWEAQPHPDLAAAFAEIEPNETPPARIKRFQQLVQSKPDHPETKMLMAELYIAAENFPEARRALGDLPSNHPTARSLTLMAAIERGEGGNEAVVRGWLAKALTAPRGPQWVCENCHNIHAKWVPVCENCSSFDTLSWTEPPEQELSIPGAGGMLPLLVGGAGDDAPTPAPVMDVTPKSDPATATASSGETTARGTDAVTDAEVLEGAGEGKK